VGDEIDSEVLLGGVGIRMGGALHGLLGDPCSQFDPFGQGDEVVEELVGRRGRVEDYPGVAPALGGALLKEPEAVAVAVAQIMQARFR
jgi:hypothetical protein